MASLIAAAGATSVLLVLGAVASSQADRPTTTRLQPVVARAITDRSATHQPDARSHLRPCPPSARACVDIRHHLAWLQRDGAPTYGPVPIAVGGPGHRTPRGTFHVAWKARDWTSTEYGLPMPWSVFFAAGGIAFHGGSLRHPSHGCVHLRRRDARAFFERLDVGAVVVVR
jgi:hypothetical protein